MKAIANSQRKIGNNVTPPSPDVDKAEGDFKNITRVVIQINEDRFYKTGTKHGVLQELDCR